MAEYSYFLFENFDADQEAQNPGNPRRILGTPTDDLITFVAGFPAGTCSCAACEKCFGAAQTQKLIRCGVLRTLGDTLFFDAPIFLQADASILEAEILDAATVLFRKLEPLIPGLYALCRKIGNGFSEEENLYHLLCGMVFDGDFFSCLEARGTAATGRVHPSGLDYLTVIYETCPELESYANGLLCSYNRFMGKSIALQSFGDAAGDRLDLYRFSRLAETGRLPEAFLPLLPLWNRLAGGKEALLNQARQLAQKGSCAQEALEILTAFGYVRDGHICVPVYDACHREILREMTALVDDRLGKAFSDTLLHLSSHMDITAIRHGVPAAEIANELYHLLFGTVNKILVRQSYAARPDSIPGQGRYLRSIQLW